MANPKATPAVDGLRLLLAPRLQPRLRAAVQHVGGRQRVLWRAAAKGRILRRQRIGRSARVPAVAVKRTYSKALIPFA